MRDLAHGIYPPLLADRGLRDAVRAALRRVARRRATLDCDGIGRYPAEVEATVYFCCLEAIQNAAKHAGPDARVVSAALGERTRPCCSRSPTTVAGFDPAAAARASGLTNMRDRVGAQGGRMRVDAAPGRARASSGRCRWPLSRSCAAR